MMQLHRYLAGLLALLLVLTSQGYAVARHGPDATGTMVICTGSGPVTVLVDENGQPTGQVHVCPDCIAGLYDAAGAPPPASLMDRLTAAIRHKTAHAAPVNAATARRFHARAPPLRA